MPGQRTWALVSAALLLALLGFAWLAISPEEVRVPSPVAHASSVRSAVPAVSAPAAVSEPTRPIPDPAIDPVGAYVYAHAHAREPDGIFPVPCGSTSGVRHIGTVLPPARALRFVDLERTRFFSRAAASACLRAYARRGPIVLLGDSTSVENFYDLTWLLSAGGAESLDEALWLATRMPLDRCKGRGEACCPLEASGVQYRFCSSHHNASARIGPIELRSEYITPGIGAYTKRKRREVLLQLGFSKADLRRAATNGRPASEVPGASEAVAQGLKRAPRRPSLLILGSGHHDMAGCYKGGSQKAWQFKCNETTVLDTYRLGLRRLVSELLLPTARLGTTVVWRSCNPTVPLNGHRSMMLSKLDVIALEEMQPVIAAGGGFVNVSAVLVPYLLEATSGVRHLPANKLPYTDDGGTHIGAIAHFYRNRTHSLEASMLVTQLLLNATCDRQLARCGARG